MAKIAINLPSAEERELLRAVRKQAADYDAGPKSYAGWTCDTVIGRKDWTPAIRASIISIGFWHPPAKARVLKQRQKRTVEAGSGPPERRLDINPVRASCLWAKAQEGRDQNRKHGHVLDDIAPVAAPRRHAQPDEEADDRKADRSEGDRPRPT